MKRQDTQDAAARADQPAEDSGLTDPVEGTALEAEDEAAKPAAELTDTRKRIKSLEAALAGAHTARESAAAEVSELRSQLEAAQIQARQAALKYREARLSAMPEVPPEMVPDSDDILEIERGLDLARRLSSRVRERLQQESEAAGRSLRVPAGAPARREPDISSLSAAEKIRIGLEQLAQKEGH